VGEYTDLLGCSNDLIIKQSFDKTLKWCV